ncbi:MAG: TetR/AcrR family transcriptional regulator [Gammaproteobacteria bacterium]|nr:TetR/AcrR family transcriptional regulator [Gammaproteobacteria bacterium]
MVGPQKQFDKDAALDRALAVFWRQGYELTSMQDLVKGMGINRASLYDTFGNKNQLYKLALQRYKDQAIATTRALLLDAPGSVRERLLNYFYSLKDAHKSDEGNFGCFLNNTAVELGPHQPDIAMAVRGGWTDMEKIFQEALDQAVNNGELSPDTNTAAIAATINMMLQGISVMAKAGTPEQQLGQIIETVLSLLGNPEPKG